MKITLLPIICSLFMLSFLNIRGQTNFQEGYFINNNGDKTECLILNEDWKTNPKSFEFRLSANAEVRTGRIENIKVFGVENKFKYVRHEVMIGKNLRDLQPSKDNSALDFEKETLFLKVLIEGKTDLYHFESGSLNIYFIKNPETNNVEQLIFKTYANTDNRIKYNNQFRTQLYKILNSDDIDRDELRNVDYNKDDLIEIIKQQSDDTENNQTVTFYKKSKFKFNLYAKAGAGFSSFSAKGPVLNQNLEYDENVNLRIGFDFETILPFKNNKWRLFLSPTYQY